MNNDWNIKDDEIRIIGADRPPQKEDRPQKKTGIAWTFALLAVIPALLLLLFFGSRRSVEPDEPGLFESGDTIVEVHHIVEPVLIEPFGDYTDTSGLAYTEVLQKTVNDIPLTLFIPHNAVPELCLKTPDYRNKDIIFATQAADIRRDNQKIVGAFVLKGEPLAWGLSKKGFCGIIDGTLTVGVADNSPLFEQATETGGYFFRQYPLVDNGQLVENEPKNKSIRKALCERAGEIFIAKSETTESFHDFAQALVDLGVDNAIYLVGSSSYGFWYGKDGDVEEFSDRRVSRYRYESYILWRGKKE